MLNKMIQMWIVLTVALTLIVGLLSLEPIAVVQAAPVLTVTPITWDVLGLDSNKVMDGPDTYPVGARVCNVGDTMATNVQVTFVREGTVNPYLTLQGANMLTRNSLAAGSTTHALGNTGPTPENCADFYFNITITRDANAYHTVQPYHIEVTADGLGTVRTPANRQLYVEQLVSQNRNDVLGFTGATEVTVGQTYQYVVTAKTATNGYEQLVTAVDFPNVMFQVLAVTVSYSTPTGATNNGLYADACGWDPNIGPTTPQGTYLSCTPSDPGDFSGGKAGGNITMVYTVKILSPGMARLTPVIYDYSGSSFHYNSDYGLDVLTVTASNPTSVNLVSLEAAPEGEAILVTWETAQELDNLGFNLYRSVSPNGPWGKLNATLISPQHPGSVLGGVYTWLDTDVAGGDYYYRLEDVDIYGARAFHGPVQARMAASNPFIVYLPLVSQGTP